MSLAFFNTLTRRKDPFVPIHGGEVRLYTCGPTVYDYPHIGNFRAYAFEDVLRRWLKYSGFRVTQVMNLTDVDDKTIQGSRQKGVTLNEYTRPYIDIFFQDLDMLNIERAEHYPRATEHVSEMVEIIQGLLNKGMAYRGEDGSLYYNVAKFPDYGKLAHLEVGDLKAGARVRHDEYDKEQAADFALWKAWDPEDGEVFWETALGKGRPGWHIECSAMSMKYLGPHFDLHTGGVDNIFPHHQNEIAQSEAFTGKPFVNYWLHAEHLIVNGRKMSKSFGNFHTVRDVLDKGYSPNALRYFYVSSHYRNKLNFTFDALQAAQSAVTRIQDFMRRLPEASGQPWPGVQERLEKAATEFREGMDDDLNTPRAVAALHDLIGDLNTRIDRGEISPPQAVEAARFFLDADRILGLKLQISLPELPAEIEALILAREDARKVKDFKRADALRETLKEKGVLVEDTPRGPRWKRL